MDNREAKRILAYVEGELTLTSDHTDWEKLAKMIYSVGSYLLDRHVEAAKQEPFQPLPQWERKPGDPVTPAMELMEELNHPQVVIRSIKGSLFKDEQEGCGCGD